VVTVIATVVVIVFVLVALPRATTLTVPILTLWPACRRMIRSEPPATAYPAVARTIPAASSAAARLTPEI
jgi:hypothetical protein